MKTGRPPQRNRGGHSGWRGGDSFPADPGSVYTKLGRIPGRRLTMSQEAGPVPDRAKFAGSTEPFRRELLAHCYRMVGSVDEAEDLVQETFLRAWRAYDGFEGRSSVRTWLYQIATNACLTAIERRGRRPLPSGLGGPDDDPAAPVVSAPEVPWLQPIPDALLASP